VVKLERHDRAIVAAEPTAPAGLVNEDLLDAPAATHDRLLPTQSTAEGASAVEHVLDLAMPRAEQRHL
jgi:hypothetical protein